METEVIKRLDLKDDQTFKAGDAIDVKASIGLVVITFLATQTGVFLTTAGPGQRLQLWAAVSLAVAGALALLELWPRDYLVETTEGLEGWLSELRDYYRNETDREARVAAAMTAGQIKRTRQRIENNGQINDRKSRYLIWSFRFTAVALTLNLITLILRAAAAYRP